MQSTSLTVTLLLVTAELCRSMMASSPGNKVEDESKGKFRFNFDIYNYYLHLIEVVNTFNFEQALNHLLVAFDHELSSINCNTKLPLFLVKLLYSYKVSQVLVLKL